MDIAVLDEYGIIREVKTVSEGDYKTDIAARTIQLAAGHDMHQRIGAYQFDFLRGCFLPVNREPLTVAERETPDLVHTLVAIADELHEKGIINLSTEQRKSLSEWRVAKAKTIVSANPEAKIVA